MRTRSAIALSVLSFVAGGGLVLAQQQAQTTTRDPQFENSLVKAWKTTMIPGAPLALHRHDHGRALIALTDGKVKVVDSLGKQINTYNWVRGKAYWLDADPGTQKHADINDSGKPIEVIVVELQKDK